MHTSFKDQTDPYMLHGIISLAYTTNTPKDTSSSTGPSGRRTQIETFTEPSTSIEDRSLDNETPICQVQPLLGTTHRENLQLWNRNQLEDIADVLGTTAFKGYVNTPLQTLDSIVVQQTKRFLPLAE